METNTQTLVRLAYLGWIVSLVIHIAAIMNYAFLTDIIPMLLFILILFLYLQSSRRIREILRQSGDESIWRLILERIPGWTRWAVTVFAIYAIVNFLMFYVKSDQTGYINFDVPAIKLRIVSGFLMALFAAAATLTTTFNKNQNNSYPKSDS